MRLLVARCEVTYTGRLTTVLPEATRLLMFKEDGSFLVHDDAGGYNGRSSARSRQPIRLRGALEPRWRDSLSVLGHGVTQTSGRSIR